MATTCRRVAYRMLICAALPGASLLALGCGDNKPASRDAAAGTGGGQVTGTGGAAGGDAGPGDAGRGTGGAPPVTDGGPDRPADAPADGSGDGAPDGPPYTCMSNGLPGVMLANAGQTIPLVVSANDFSGVRKVAALMQADIRRVSGAPTEL